MDYLDLLIDRFHLPLYRFCFHLTGDPDWASELYQETWIRVMRKIHKCNPDQNFEGWLFTLTANLFRDLYRKKKRLMSRTQPINKERIHITDPGLGPQEQLVRSQQNQELRDCLQKLDDIYRIPLILFYFHDASQQQIAEIMGVPLGTIKSRLSNGKKRLKVLLEVAK